MKKQKGDLTRAERLEIGILIRKKYSIRSIAREMQRSPNTISYEIKENSTNDVYEPVKAHAKARLRKRMRKLEWSKIEKNTTLKAFIIKKLKEHWNPDEIAGYLKRTNKEQYVSKTAIYLWLRTARGERYCYYLYSKRTYVKKRKPKTKKIIIPNRVGILRRTVGAHNRSRYGHMENDTIVSKKGCSGGVSVHQERKSRLVAGIKVSSMRPSEHKMAAHQIYEVFKVKSSTMDNGIENREHEQFGVPTYFCDAYSSWQKGSVENVNKMLRRYFPKGTDFSKVSQKQINRACAIINKKPRKILGYRSSLEVARRAGIIKKESVLIQG